MASEQRFITKDLEIRKGPNGYGITPLKWTVSETVAEGFEMPDELSILHAAGQDGAVIQHVLEEGPADQAGLRKWDVVRFVQNKQIATYSEFVEAIKAHPEKEPLLLTVLRACVGGEAFEMQVFKSASQEE